MSLHSAPCPFCLTVIDINVQRCPRCTSWLNSNPEWQQHKVRLHNELNPWEVKVYLDANITWHIEKRSWEDVNVYDDKIQYFVVVELNNSLTGEKIVNQTGSGLMHKEKGFDTISNGRSHGDDEYTNVPIIKYALTPSDLFTIHQGIITSFNSKGYNLMNIEQLGKELKNVNGTIIVFRGEYKRYYNARIHLYIDGTSYDVAKVPQHLIEPGVHRITLCEFRTAVHR